MSRWTATRIAAHMTSLLRDARLILVSNRAPYSHRWQGPAPPARSADHPSVPGTAVGNVGWQRRVPVQVSRIRQSDHALRWSQPAGGLTAALDPVMQACHGTWVAWGHGSADRQAVDAHDHIQVPPHNPQYTLRCVWLSEAQVQGFYEGFANSALWPLCHLHLQHAVFKPCDWRHYQEVNAHFATVVAEECRGERALVWLQDYHLAPG
jgi:trehalose-6-phosphate synthase